MRFFLHKKISGSLICALSLAVIISAIHARLLYWDYHFFSLEMLMRSSVSGEAKLYYDTGNNLSERESSGRNVTGDFRFHTYDFALPCKTIYNLRFDPPVGVVSIQRISVVNSLGTSLASIDLHTLRPEKQIKALDLKESTVNIFVEEGADDPQIRIHLNSSLELDTFLHLTTIRFAGRLLGGFLIIFLSSFFLIWILRRQGILIGFIDHPVGKSYRWIRDNKLFLGVILSIFAYRVFFVLTYPLNTCSDAWKYYQLMRSYTSTLIHATGYPFFMHFFSALLPTKTDVLVFQHFIDFGTQLILMILLKKRFGRISAITAGLFYGLELRSINWVSLSTPEWLQGVFFALAFVGAMEAYFAKKSAKKIVLYLLSAWAFAWTVLMKFLTVVLLPVYPILFIMERRQWKGKWLCLAAMGILVFAQLNIFVYFYHYPSTGEKAFTKIIGWTLHRKISFFLPEGRHLSESGPWSRRYCILISEMPNNVSEQDSKIMGIHELFSHVDAVPQSIRKPYLDRYRELSAKSDSELQTIMQTKQYARGIWPAMFIASYYYLGLPETDSLLEKVFLEVVASYPKEYFLNVVKGIKDAFFIETSYYIATVGTPFFSSLDHPFQVRKDDTIRDIGWGYVLFNSPTGSIIHCMYDDPIFLKSGLQFFSAWGNWVNIPVIIKWLFIFLGSVLAYIGYRKDKRFHHYILYLSLGIMVLFLLILESNLILGLREKEFEACQHLMSVVLGISVSSIIEFRKLKS